MIRTFVVILSGLCVVGGLVSPAAAVVRTCSTAAQIDSAWRAAGSGDTILIMPGTYNLVSGIQMNATNLTVRGFTGNRDDVVLIGGGMNTRGVDEGILMNTDGGTVRDLTLKDFYYHAVHIRAENDADNLTVSNLKTWNIGQRHIKGSRGAVSLVSENVLIERVYMLQDMARNHPDDPDYLGGIDAMGIDNWTIRDCVAKGINSEHANSNAAIFLWSGASNLTLERNRIYDCQKGIALGNPYYGGGGWHTGNFQVAGAIMRNNIVRRTTGTDGNNIGLEFCNTKDVKVYSNTIYSDNAGYSRTFSVLDDNGGGITTNLDPKNNIIRGTSWEMIPDHSAGDWSNAALAAMGNIVDGAGTVVTAGWFVDPSASVADFHLTELAAAAIGHGLVLADVPTDFDGEARPYGNFPDMGADEWRLAGDTNLDLDVDFTDYQALERNFGRTGGKTWAQGDFDHDGDVDFTDYQALELNFGRVLNPANYDVPEPASASLLSIAGLALLRRRFRTL